MGRSQPWLEERIDLGSNAHRIDGRQSAPSFDQRLGGRSALRDRAQLGNRFTRLRDRDRLAASGTVDHLTAVVAEVADAYGGHERNVSRVIHIGMSAGSAGQYAVVRERCRGKAL